MVDDPTPWWEVAAAIAAVASAIAGAGGATAAWFAATASRKTSQDALEALAVGIRPVVDLAIRVLDGRFVVWVVTPSDWEPTNLTLAADVPRRGKIRDSHERLAQNKEAMGTMTQNPPYWEVELGTRTEEWPAEDETAVILLRWSDARGIARYEREYRWNLKPSMGELAMPKPSLVQGEEKRIR